MGFYFGSEERQSKQSALFGSREKRLLFNKAYKTEKVIRSVKAQKQLLSLVGAPWQVRRQEAAVEYYVFCFAFTAFFSSASAFSPFSTSLQNVLQGLPRGRGKDSRSDFIFTKGLNTLFIFMSKKSKRLYNLSVELI